MFSLSLVAALCAATTGAPAHDAARPVKPASVCKSANSVRSQLDKVIELTNLARSREGLAPLVVNDRLSAAASAHARDMAQKGYFDHLSPNGEGPEERCRRAGVADFSGENICMGTPTAKPTVDLWLASPGHRSNILSASNRETGVGFAKNPKGETYWVQLFGAP